MSIEGGVDGALTCSHAGVGGRPPNTLLYSCVLVFFSHMYLSPIEKNLYLGNLLITTLVVLDFASGTGIHSPELLSWFTDEL